MKAVVFHKIGNIALENVPEPEIIDPTDAIVRITSSSICGTDLHMVRGTMAGMKNGQVLGHEAVGIVEKLGKDVKSFFVGQRVVICSTIACGQCAFCQTQEYSSCDNANPRGKEAGTAFFGGPIEAGGFEGLQAERARVPFADFTMVALDPGISDDDALLCSDVFPTGYMAAEMADIKEGDIVAVFGCGPVGQMAIASAKLLGAKKIIAVDCLPDRLAMAEEQGAQVVDYDRADPVKTLRDMSNGYGPDSVIDAVGIDAQPATHVNPVQKLVSKVENEIEKRIMTPQAVVFGDHWNAGGAPLQVLTWCVESVRKSGVVSIVGVYPPTMMAFPIGMAMGKALTIRAANCSHRKYIPKLLDLISKGKFSPSKILTRAENLEDVIYCYENFDKRHAGWVKVKLEP